MTDTVKVSCVRCGGPVAEFSLIATSDGDAGQGKLQRTGFIVHVTKFGAEAELRRLLEFVRIADYASARAADADFFAFHCWKCKRSYCERCWRVGPPEFDEGFYDCTHAVCPEGHEQIVDD